MPKIRQARLIGMPSSRSDSMKWAAARRFARLSAIPAPCRKGASYFARISSSVSADPVRVSLRVVMTS